jgi:hypothetical protein
MPDRKVTCVDCWASSTFPDGEWEKDQRPVGAENLVHVTRSGDIR